MDSIDEIHAKNIENDTVVTIFFDSACATVSAVFLPFVICSIMGIKNVMTLWYLCQSFQLVSINVDDPYSLFPHTVFGLVSQVGALKSHPVSSTQMSVCRIPMRPPSSGCQFHSRKGKVDSIRPDYVTDRS